MKGLNLLLTLSVVLFSLVAFNSFAGTVNGNDYVNIIDDDGDKFSVNREGRIDVVQHSHPDSSVLHFHASGLTASQSYVLIDISDIANYAHVSTTYVHIESLVVQVDSDVNGDYELEIGFLENVDATDGDFYGMYDVPGTKKVGNSQIVHFNGYPNAARMSSDHVTTSTIELNNTDYQTDVNLASTLDPTTADTPSGNNDVILKATINAGTIDIRVDVAYHTH